MLDRTRNADRDVKLGGDDLAGLADLPVVRRIARIHRRAAGTDSGIELVCKLFDQREIGQRAHAAPARDDDPSTGQVGPVGRGDLVLHPGRQAAIDRGRDLFDRRCTARARRVKRCGADRHHLLRVRRLDGLDRVTGIDRPVEGGSVMHRQHLGNHHHVQKRRHPGQHRFRQRTRRGHDMLVILGKCCNQRRRRFGHAVCIARVIGQQHLGHARQRCRLGCGSPGPSARHKDGHRTKRLHRSQRLGHLIGGKLAVIHIGKKKNRHQITPASSLSFAIRSSTDFTLTPALRPAGSTVFKTESRGATSTP